MDRVRCDRIQIWVSTSQIYVRPQIPCPDLPPGTLTLNSARPRLLDTLSDRRRRTRKSLCNPITILAA